MQVELCVCAQSLYPCLTLADPMDYSLPGSSVHGILQARILECVAIPSSRRSSLPRDRTLVSCVSYPGRRVLYPQGHLGSLEVELGCSVACGYVSHHCSARR